MGYVKDLYIDLRWCKPHSNDLEQYEALEQSLIVVELKIKGILKAVINKTENLKMHMIIHSVFPINAHKSGDWLVKFMIDELYPSDKEVAEAFESEEVPDWIMKKLAIFKPRALCKFGYISNERIEYEMWGNPKEGGSYDPINVIDRGWEEYEKEIAQKKYAIESLNQFETIKI